jgi:hypothetical protein
MSLNRYDTISTSTYDPRSLQETLMVPMMKRQQHDKANEQLYANLAELDKIKPLDKHYNEAQKIKAELSNRINDQAGKLATEGFNTNTTTDLFKTNRDIQSMYSPTGKIGQINAAKEAYDKDSAEYLKNATALGHSPEVVQRNLKAIQDQYNSTPVYDEKGKVINMSINALPPKYIDHIARAREFFKDAGISSSDIDNLSSNIVSDAKGNYVLSKGFKGSNASNTKALQSAVNFLNNEINNPNSDVGKSLKYGFKTPAEAIEDIKMMSPIYKSIKTASGSSSQISNFTPFDPTKQPGYNSNTGSAFGEDYNVREVGGKDYKGYEELNKIGSQISENYTTDAAGGVDATYRSFNINDVKDPAARASFVKRFNDLKKGVVINGQKIKLSEADIKKGMHNDGVAKYVVKSLQSSPITLKSKLMTTDQMINDKGFAAALGKDIAKIDSNMRRQLERDGNSGRKLVDPETGKTMTYSEAKDKYNLGELSTLHYQGYISPHNWEDMGQLGSNSRFSPHVITIMDKNGNPIEFKTSRLSSDNLGGNVARANDLTKNYRTATLDHDNWNDFESKSKAFDGVKVRYNSSPSSVDENTGEPKNFTIQFKNGKTVDMPESVYMNWVNSVK